MEYLRYLYLGVLVVSGVYALINIKKEAFYIKVYLIVTLGVEIAGYFYLFFFQTPFAVLYNLHAILEIWLWLNFYISITAPIQKKKVILVFIFYVLGYALLGRFNLNYLNSNGFLLNNFFVTSLVLLYLYYVLKNMIELDGYFLIFVGALFFNFGGFFLTGLIQIVAKENLKLGSQLFQINTILNIVFYFLVFYGLIKLDKRSVDPF